MGLYGDVSQPDGNAGVYEVPEVGREAIYVEEKAARADRKAEGWLVDEAPRGPPKRQLTKRVAHGSARTSLDHEVYENARSMPGDNEIYDEMYDGTGNVVNNTYEEPEIGREAMYIASKNNVRLSAEDEQELYEFVDDPPARGCETSELKGLVECSGPNVGTATWGVHAELSPLYAEPTVIQNQVNAGSKEKNKFHAGAELHSRSAATSFTGTSKFIFGEEDRGSVGSDDINV